LVKLHKSGIIIRGLISPPIFENGKKTGIALQDLETGEIKPAARLREEVGSGLFTQKWQFDTEVMKWGDEVLSIACPCNLLVIDEVGPLELERGEGWQNAIRQLDERRFNFALVVIRPALLKTALSRWPDAQVFEVNRKNQDPLSDKLLAVFKSEPSFGNFNP
jgi:nucleoside-triphosphatase THEP1